MFSLTATSSPPQRAADVVTPTEAYRPLLELGRGGMARVYLAERTVRGLRKLVVLKVLDPNLAQEAHMRLAFRREAELCARLNHPNIVQVFEVLDEGAAPMMVMEYVEGVSLSQVISRSEHRLPLRLHIHIIIQVLAGLHYFHELRDLQGNAQLPVHRDVSPQNVLVMHEGVVKVLDFGIAKLRDAAAHESTEAGVIKGKLAYMPGEQLSGDTTIDRRADVFAAGVMLWEAFARRRMWRGEQQQDVVKALVAGRIPQIRDACPWISPEWANIVTRATAGKREDRFASALEMQIAMEECMDQVGGPVRQRELSNFMLSEFGEWRAERQRLVDAEASKPPVVLSAVLGTSVSGATQLAQLATPTIDSYAQERPMRPWARTLGGLVLLAALVMSAVRWLSPETAPQVTTAAAASAVSSVQLTVSAFPPEARIAIDTVPKSGNPWSEVVPGVGSRHHVEVTAPGFEPHSEMVHLDRDVTLSIALRPRPAPSAAAAPSTSAPAPASVARTHQGPSAGTGRARPPATVARGVSATKPNCSPPYTLDSDGVKTYKPECF